MTVYERVVISLAAYCLILAAFLLATRYSLLLLGSCLFALDSILGIIYQ
jgi:hypothetical protein